jgi:hypothetical protein
MQQKQNTHNEEYDMKVHLPELCLTQGNSSQQVDPPTALS